MLRWTNVKELLRPYYLRWLYFRLVRDARPPYFAECWRYPYSPLGEVDRLIEQDAVERSDRATVVIYPMSDWHARTQRPQQLASGLADLGYDVIYVNPHLGRQFEQVFLRDPEHRVSLLRDRVFELHVRLPREPVFHHRLLYESEDAAVAAAVGRLADALGSKRAIQLVALPTWVDAAVMLRQSRCWPIVYDCHDFLPELPGMATEIAEADGPSMNTADLVLYSSQWLLEHHQRQLVDTPAFLLRNGSTATKDAIDAQTERSRPVAGYVGAVSHWFDVEAMYCAAQLNDDVEFVVAGSVEKPEVYRLAELPNVSLLGEVPAEDVPKLLETFTIGLIPFLISNLTLAANPIKLYEYFSYGLPVVSSGLPEVEGFRSLVYLATRPDEFAAQVQAAVREKDAGKRRRRIEVAGQQTWERRAHDLAGAIDKLTTGDAAVCHGRSS